MIGPKTNRNGGCGTRSTGRATADRDESGFARVKTIRKQAENAHSRKPYTGMRSAAHPSARRSFMQYRYLRTTANGLL
jgi:hypothetical protein